MKCKFLIAVAGAALISSVASAAVLTNGAITMGVKDDATLGDSGVGIAYLGSDAITPGCLCEGWGAAANGTGNWSYGASGQSGVVTDGLSGVTASTAVSTVELANGLTVVHDITPVAGGILFKVEITITNDSGADATDIRYARTLDWDVGPGHFTDDFTTIEGGLAPVGPGSVVFHTSFDPFAPPDPMVTRGSLSGSPPANTDGMDIPGDLGSYFIFSFGDLLDGESTTFTTYIGAAPTTAALLAAFGLVSVEAYSYTWDDDDPRGVTFGYGFEGLGLPPVIPTPEPGALGLLGLGLAGLALRRRKRS